jgi:adenylate cyclase
MDRFARRFAERATRAGAPVGGTRIGVCSGPVIVGHVGGRGRLDYRALGDPINTAKRLEDANRYIGTRVCVAGATVALDPNFVGRPIGLLQLAGKREPVEAWEALQLDAPELASLDTYREAFEHMADERPGALDTLKALERERPDDQLVRFHRRRLEAGERGILIDLSKRPAAVPAGRAPAERSPEHPRVLPSPVAGLKRA